MKKIIYLLIILSTTIVSCDNTKQLYRVQENGLYGFIDSLGNVIIKPQYKYVGDFTQDGYACVVSDLRLEKDSSIESFTKELFPDIADSCIRITYGYINHENKLVVDTTNHLYIPFIRLHDKTLITFAHKYINGQLDFRSYSLIELALSNGLFVYLDGKNKNYGYKDVNGRVQIEAQYLLSRFFYDGVAIVIISLTEYRCSALTIPRGAHSEYRS